MKKFSTVIAVVLMSVSLMLVLGACDDKDKNKDDNGNGVQSENGVNNPPAEDKVFDGDGWNFERFGDGSGDGFSVTIEDDDIIIEGEQTFEVDLSDPDAQNNSRRSFSSSSGE